MTIKDLLNQNKQKLQKFSPTPDIDGEILLASVLKKNREFLFSHFEEEVSKEKITKFNTLIERRIAQEPIAYITGKKNFYGRDFKVTRNTLIPRPETELLIEKTLEYCHKEFYPSQKIIIIDVGTGSGCIPITLLKELKKGHFKNSRIKTLGTDISSQALEIAKKNSDNLKTDQKNDFLEGNLLKPALERYLEYLKNAQIAITANLPYLSQKVYENCPKSVLDFEPKEALLADSDGLGLYIELLSQIKASGLPYLAKNLYLIFEISPEQEKIAKKEFSKIFPDLKIKFSKDLAQKWRFIEIFF